MSLFSGSGIGDLGWRASGVEFVAMCEIDPRRAAIAAHNFPEAHVFAEPIESVTDALVGAVHARTGGGSPWIVVCTPPCQGMSKSGQGTLLANIRAGKRPRLDPRNRLVVPALRVLKALHPEWIVFENVVEMKNTLIEDDAGQIVRIVDAISSALGDEYVGAFYEVEMADYGVPQRRQRLISVLTRDPKAKEAFENGGCLIPMPTHAGEEQLSRSKWVSVEDALQGFPALDAATRGSATSTIPYHRVPVLDSKKYWWVASTAEGSSAFDNQCVNPACGFDENPTHGSERTGGINRSRQDTPIYCAECGELLPRPTSTADDGSLRLMSGFKSSYKRMRGDLPASALTRNLSYPCSDNKVHPTQNRVLSLAEAFVIQTIAQFDYEWTQAPVFGADGVRHEIPKRGVPDTLIRLALGESVPPQFFRILAEHLLEGHWSCSAADSPVGERFGRQVAPTGVGLAEADVARAGTDVAQLALVP